MEKSKNKQIDKENIQVETASADKVMQLAAIPHTKKEETSPAIDVEQENNENQTVVEAQSEGSDVKIQNEENICKENNT